MSGIKDAIAEFTDEQLLAAYFREKEHYTEEALAIMREELSKRNLPEEQNEKTPADGGGAETAPLVLKSEDFVRFDYSFSRTDLLLATAVLRDNAVPFFVDNPTSTDIIPIENEAEKRYTVHVHKTALEQTHALLDEHFVKADNRSLLKYTGARDRLRAFNFHDIHLTENAALEELDVSFAPEEINVVIALGRRLLGEADIIEKTQERILFYYDSIEPLIGRLQERGRTSLSRNDLLTMLEIMQVYAGNPSLPQSMDEAISQLLEFFLHA
jgi:hypothetical protein